MKNVSHVAAKKIIHYDRKTTTSFWAYFGSDVIRHLC